MARVYETQPATHRPPGAEVRRHRCQREQRGDGARAGEQPVRIRREQGEAAAGVKRHPNAASCVCGWMRDAIVLQNEAQCAVLYGRSRNQCEEQNANMLQCSQRDGETAEARKRRL